MKKRRAMMLRELAKARRAQIQHPRWVPTPEEKAAMDAGRLLVFEFANGLPPFIIDLRRADER